MSVESEVLERRALLSAGDLNLAFGGGDGKLRFDAPVAQGVVVNVAAQPDGKFVIGGYALQGSNKFVWLERFNAIGKVDRSFGNAGVVKAQITSDGGGSADFARQKDGKFVVVAGTKTGGFLARYTASGKLDTTFGGGDGIVLPAGQLGRVIVRPNHRIVVASTSAVFEYHSDGTLNKAFAHQGSFKIPFNFTNAIAVQPDNKLLLGGDMSAEFGDTHGAILRMTPGGKRDASFGSNGLVDVNEGFHYQSVRGIAVQTSGRIVAAAFDDDDNNYVLGFRSDGSSDPRFHSGQQNFSSQNEDLLSGISLFSNDHVLLFGAVSTNFAITQHDFAAAGLTSSGKNQFFTSADFSSPSTDHDDIPEAATVTSTGDILLVGNSDTDSIGAHTQIEIALLKGH